ncbi:MAG: ABC transporter permease [Weeksellaceae bacterium]|nr:ABC transporter permease [Weeksellaceae bacterium]
MKNWSQILLITKREFLVQVKKKSFLVVTIITPLIMVALIALVVFLTMANASSSYVAVVDESGLFTTTFRSTDRDKFAFYDKADLQGLRDTLQNSDYLTAILHIPPADSGFANLRNGIELTSNRSVGITEIMSYQDRLSDRLEQLNLERQGVTQQQLRDARFPVSLNVRKQSGDSFSDTNQMGEGIKTGLAYMLMYAIFMFIMIYGVRVMRSVIEEKNNRVVEIIISSVKPFNLMLGKIMGTTLVALTQFVIWIGIILIAMMLIPVFLPASADMSLAGADAAELVSEEGLGDIVQDVIGVLFSLNYWLIILAFLVYFLFGYMLYSSFFAAIGASVDNETETQQFMWIGLMPLMLGVYGSISIIQNPDGPVGFWMSMVPFTSPVAMMARIAYGVPTWQLIVSMLLLVLSVIGMVWVSAKIYRVGILMYGKKPSFKEMWKWLRYS